MTPHWARESLLVAGCIGIVGRASAQKPFEGVIEARINTPMGSATASYSIKGQKIRMDMSMAAGLATAMVFDRDAHVMYVLIPSRRSYIEREIPDTVPVTASKPSGHALVWTGKRETIAGLSCDDATVTEDDGAKIDMCIAKGVTYFERPGMAHRAPGSWQEQVEGGFPLKVQREDEATPAFEATKVERKTLADDVFAPPAGWRRMSTPMDMPMGRR